MARILMGTIRLLTDGSLAHILAPGAYARIPIVDRIGKVKVPVTFMCELSSSSAWLKLNDVHYRW